MVFELKRFGTIGGMGKGNLSFQLFSYRTKNESIDDLLTTGYFKDLQGAVAINDIILILNLEEKDDYKQVEFLVVKDLDIKLGITVERLKSSYLPAEILPLVSSNNGAIGVSVNFARADHSHPKAISSETERGEIIIATQEEVNEGIEDTKAITSLKNKTYFNNSFDNRQATDEEIEEGTDIKKYLNPKQIKDIKDEIYNNVDILDNNIIALNNDVVNLNNNKANIDLNNLSTAGQAIIDNKANVDLNNLSSTGQTYIKSLVDENVLNRDIDNLTATGISNLQNYLIPDYNSTIDFKNTIDNNTVTYTAPNNGVINISAQSTGPGSITIQAIINDIVIGQSTFNGGTPILNGQYIIGKNDIFKVTITGGTFYLPIASFTPFKDNN